jgi:hypothetical protein
MPFSTSDLYNFYQTARGSEGWKSNISFSITGGGPANEAEFTIYGYTFTYYTDSANATEEFDIHGSNSDAVAMVWAKLQEQADVQENFTNQYSGGPNFFTLISKTISPINLKTNDGSAANVNISPDAGEAPDQSIYMRKSLGGFVDDIHADNSRNTRLLGLAAAVETVLKTAETPAQRKMLKSVLKTMSAKIPTVANSTLNDNNSIADTVAVHTIKKYSGLKPLDL